MMDSTPATTTKIQEERAKMERRSIQMRKQSQRLCQAPAADDLPSIAGLKEEALDTQDVLNSLHEIMTSIHSMASTLGDESDFDDEDEFGGDSDEEEINESKEEQ